MGEVLAGIDATGLGRAKTVVKGLAKGLGYVASAVAKDDGIPMPTRNVTARAKETAADLLTRPTGKEIVAQRKSKTTPTS